MTEEQALRLFPNIDLKGLKITSPVDEFCNCFAWAGKDTKNNWSPVKWGFFLWLTDNPSESLENFIANYGLIGYREVADSEEFEPGFEKIAIYVKDGFPEHAARQLENGFWTSKVGELEDIEHRTLKCLECDTYGKVAIILKKSVDEHPAKHVREQVAQDFEKFKELAKNLARLPKEAVETIKNKTPNRKVKKRK